MSVDLNDTLSLVKYLTPLQYYDGKLQGQGGFSGLHLTLPFLMALITLIITCRCLARKDLA
jgi:hypothetical protein